MAFTIPNEADAFHADQAEPDKVDIDILVAGLNGNGVVSGCAVTAQGTPDMTVAVAAGVTRNADGTTATVAAGNVTVTAADGTNPRIDLIVVGNTGTKSCTAGTAAASPVFPAIPATSVVFAAVYVPANDTAIATNQITDKRVILAYQTATVAKVATSEDTASTSFADLTTPGPSVTVTVPASGKVKITISARMKNSTAGIEVYMGVDISGANTVAAATILMSNGAAGKLIEMSRTTVLTGLTPGSTTFKMQYAVAANTGTFLNREIVAELVD